MKLTAVPKGWFSYDFCLLDPRGQALAEILLSSWRERGAVLIGGAPHPVRPQGLFGPWVMSAPDGSEVASAVKPRLLRRTFTIHYCQREYMLTAASAFRRQCGLFQGERPIGAITPKSWLSRRAEVLFDDAVSLPLLTFATWLTLLLWKRDAEADGPPQQVPVAT